MSIKSLCAAAVVAVGMAQAANAATVISYDISLRYEGTYYREAMIYYEESGEGYEFDSLLAENSDFELPVLRKGMNIGDEVTFRATLEVPDDPYDYDNWPDYYASDNGGRARLCKIAGVNCAENISATFLEPQIFMGEYSGIYFGTKIGEKLLYDFNLDYESNLLFDWGSIYFVNRTAEFSIVSYNSTIQPAPVPVPFSAALLPVGIGALAMMRRRRARG